MSDELILINNQQIQSRIFTIRGLQVMVDSDLAELYQVETRVLNQAVKRNTNRFPTEFMFQLTMEEFEDWKSQLVTSSKKTLISQFVTSKENRGAVFINEGLKQSLRLTRLNQIAISQMKILLKDNVVEGIGNE